MVSAAPEVDVDALKNVSHDLRTPLNAIIGFTQMMELGLHGKVDNPHYTEYLRHIRESGYDLLSQIDLLLESGEQGNNAMHIKSQNNIHATTHKKIAEHA